MERAALDLAWERDPGQRSRALDSLLVDGLIEVTDDESQAMTDDES